MIRIEWLQTNSQIDTLTRNMYIYENVSMESLRLSTLQRAKKGGIILDFPLFFLTPQIFGEKPEIFEIQKRYTGFSSKLAKNFHIKTYFKRLSKFLIQLK